MHHPGRLKYVADASSLVPASAEIEPMCQAGERSRFFTPSTLGFVGLALAVVLWAFNYRLSLYYPHPHSASPSQVVKLWVEQRNASGLIVVRTSAKVHRFAHTHAIHVLGFRLAGWVAAGAWLVVAATPRRAANLYSIPSFRSPPSPFLV